MPLDEFLPAFRFNVDIWTLLRAMALLNVGFALAHSVYHTPFLHSEANAPGKLDHKPRFRHLIGGLCMALGRLSSLDTPFSGSIVGALK